jgi:hypothetical protein
MPDAQTLPRAGKRKKAAAADSSLESSNRPAKKGRSEPRAEGAASLAAPHQPIITELSPKYHVLAASVLSSTQIRKRVSYVNGHLLEAGPGRSPVALLHARPRDVCKLITVVEQCRRLLRGAGKPCYQYNQLFTLPPAPLQKDRRDVVEETELRHDTEAADSDDDDFEVMASRFEKAVLPPATTRETKSMRVFLSIAPLPELRSKSDVTVQVDGVGI